MNVDYIERLLEFAQADLTNILEPEKERYLLEVKKILAGIHEHPGLGKEETFDWQEVLTMQDEWLDALNWLYDLLDNFCAIEFEVNFRGLLHWTPKDREGNFNLSTEYDGCAFDVNVTRFSFDGTAERSSGQLPRGALHLLSALDGFPTAALGRCAYCKKLFFNPTKRKQIYCSPTCRNAAGVSRYREKEGESS